jgi:uncharacterized protein (DUF1778 family)
MPKGEGEERWLEGRTRHVRVYLTDKEHAMVRAAAAKADRSVSRFSIEAIIETARRVVGAETPAAATEAGEQTTPKGKAKKGTRKRK